MKLVIPLHFISVKKKTTNFLILTGSVFYQIWLRRLTALIIFDKMHFLLMSENEFFPKIKCDERTSFIELMIGMCFSPALTRVEWVSVSNGWNLISKSQLNLMNEKKNLCWFFMYVLLKIFGPVRLQLDQLEFPLDRLAIWRWTG